MYGRKSFLPTVVALLLSATSSHSSHVIVPDDVATVQLGIDSGADTVIVKDGLAPERVTIWRYVVMEAFRASTWSDRFHALPSIRSVEADESVEMRGFRILGEFRANASGGTIAFEGCRFDSALILPSFPISPQTFRLNHCLLLDSLDAKAGWGQVIGTTAIGKGMRMRFDGLHDVRGNVVIGASGPGMRLNMNESSGEVAENTIIQCGEGFRLDGSPRMLRDNVVEHCTGDGIVWSQSAINDPARVRGNVVRSCGGRGMVILAPGTFWSVSGNRIEDAGGDGIDLQAAGIVIRADSNVVLRAGGHGIRVGLFGEMRGNIVANCVGDGIHQNPAVIAGATLAGGGTLIEQSTCALNGGTGISASGTASFRRNLSALNTGYGFEWLGGGGPELDCNDWFGNAGGATSGTAPGATDLQLDPQFCNAGNEDFSLASSSPLLAAAGCGQIGALGQGCSAVLGVGIRSSSGVLQVWPVPARGSVRFSVPPAANSVRLEIFDVGGARRWEHDIAPGIGEHEWNLRTAGGDRLPAGVYFARLGGHRDAARFVITK